VAALMQNTREARLVMLAAVAIGFATFMLCFGVVAFAYWLCGVLGLAG